jgi:hypothetical protein
VLYTFVTGQPSANHWRQPQDLRSVVAEEGMVLHPCVCFGQGTVRDNGTRVLLGHPSQLAVKRCAERLPARTHVWHGRSLRTMAQLCAQMPGDCHEMACAP